MLQKIQNNKCYKRFFTVIEKCFTIETVFFSVELLHPGSASGGVTVTNINRRISFNFFYVLSIENMLNINLWLWGIFGKGFHLMYIKLG